MPGPRRPYIAIVPPGLEPVVARELEGHGIRGVIGPGHVSFKAEVAQAPELVRSLRTPSRLQLVVMKGRARSLDELAAHIRRIDWAPVLPVRSKVEIRVTTKGSRLRVRDRVAKKAEHAMKDVLRNLRRKGSGPAGKPPPDQRIFLRVVDDQLTVNLDVSGEPLHKRGWRKVPGKAPLRENLAACLLELAGWQGDEALVDPFCGVGTIAIEAALKDARRPPHLGREYACDAWPGVSAPNSGRKLPFHQPAVPIVGSDREPMAIARAQEHAESARVRIDWRQLDVAEVEAPAPTGLVVANPPYGRRLGQNVGGVYATFGRTLRERFQGWRAVFLAPDRGLAAKVDRGAELITTFSNGGSRVGVYGLDLGTPDPEEHADGYDDDGWDDDDGYDDDDDDDVGYD